MSVKVILSLIALLVGGWMIFDGVHVLTRGRYFGPEKPGPWSDVVAAVGLDPFGFGVTFIVLGLLWLLSLAAVLLRPRHGWYAALLVAILTLWYLPVGTILALLYVALLFVYRRKLRL
jgi:hypothetical protein